MIDNSNISWLPVANRCLDFVDFEENKLKKLLYPLQESRFLCPL